PDPAHPSRRYGHRRGAPPSPRFPAPRRIRSSGAGDRSGVSAAVWKAHSLHHLPTGSLDADQQPPTSKLLKELRIIFSYLGLETRSVIEYIPLQDFRGPSLPSTQ